MIHKRGGGWTDADVGHRLRQARLRAGYGSSAAFASAHGIPRETYYSHEAGKRSIKPEVAARYAKALQIDLETLYYDHDRLHPVTTVPIVGALFAGGRVALLEDAMPKLDKASSHRSKFDKGKVGDFVDDDMRLEDVVGFQSYQVIGDGLYPYYRDGDKLVFPPFDADFDISRFHGLECIVILADGKRLVKTLNWQTNGLATLYDVKEPPMFNIAVVAASPIVFVRRNITLLADMVAARKKPSDDDDAPLEARRA